MRLGTRHHRGLEQAFFVFTAGIINLILSLFHMRDVLFERNLLAFFCRAKEQKRRKFLRARAVGAVNTKFKPPTKGIEEFLIVFGFVLLHAFKLFQHLLFDTASNSLELGILLERLTRNIERNIGRIHDAAHKIKVVGKEICALFLNQNARRVERKAFFIILAIEVKGCRRWDEQKRIIGKRTFRMKANLTQRIVPIMKRGCVELFVVFFFYIAFALFPDRHHGIDGFELLIVLDFWRLVCVRIFVLVRINVRIGILGLRYLARFVNHHLNGVMDVV